MLITNSVIVDCQNPLHILTNYAVRLNGPVIAEISPQKELMQKYPDEDVMDAKGQLLMPGNICAHTHFYGAFARGLNIEGSAPRDFIEILNKLWWPLDRSLLEEDVYFSALVCMVDAIKHGTTTLFDHHASPNCITGSLDIIEKAFLDSGLRGMVCYEVTDRGGEEKTDEGIAENLRMINKKRSDPESIIKATFGLHASLTLSKKTLEKCRNVAADDTGFHIHCAEHQDDEYDSMAKYGTRVIERLEKHQMLGKNTIVVHGVHLDLQEIDILRRTNTWLTHQPRSNMNNAVGLGDVEAMLRNGIPVCLGNDGFSNAMWDEWRTCYLAHKLWNRDPRKMPGDKVFDMGVYNNAKITQHFFGKNIGIIEQGAQADLILVEYQPYTELTEGNLPWHIIFGFRDSMVTTTIVAGKILMRDREFLFINENEITKSALKASKSVWERYKRLF